MEEKFLEIDESYLDEMADLYKADWQGSSSRRIQTSRPTSST